MRLIARARAGDPGLPAPPVAARRRLRHHPQPARRGGADRATARWRSAPSSNGTRTISTRSASSRSTCSALGMLTCIRKALELLRAFGAASIRARAGSDQAARDLRLGHHPADERRPASVYACCCARRLDRRLPGREPRADVDAAAPRADGVLRPRDRGGDRAARPDPGRHGASLSAPPARAGAGLLSRRRNWKRCCRKTLGRAAVPGAGDEDRHRRRRLHAGARPTSCAAPWRPSSAPAPSAPSATR